MNSRWFPPPRRNDKSTVPKLDVDGVGLAYDDVGRRDGVPLVFIHGWTANRHRWDDQLGHFAGRYRIVSLDLRGHSDPMGPCHRCRPPTSLACDTPKSLTVNIEAQAFTAE